MYLFLDTETGGLDPENTSLLTAYFSVVSDDLKDTPGDLMIYMPPSVFGGAYKVDPRALQINKIDLVKLAQEADRYPEAPSLRLEQFLKQHSSDGKYKLIPVAWNTYFDLSYIWKGGLLSKQTWEKYVSYRTLDLQVIGRFLMLQGKIDKNKKLGSLVSHAEYFGIDTSNAHEARADVEYMKYIFAKFLEL